MHAPQPPRKTGLTTPQAVSLGCVVILILFLATLTTIGLLAGDTETAEPTTPTTTEPAAQPTRSTTPDPTAAYIRDLDAIDLDIVHGEPDKAIDRGRNQCSSYDSTYDGKAPTKAKLIELTNQRFTSPDHPEGFGRPTAERILNVVHKHLCPDA